MTKVGSLRASDADREEIVARLHKAATEGRIASEELEQRVSAALKARTYSELDATVVDLPRQVTRRPRSETRRRSAGGWALTAVRANPWLLLFAIPLVAVTFAMVLAATVMWAVVMVIVMVLGGRPRPPRGPWMYTRHRRPYGPPRRSPRSYWA
jgi:Flp pilus assembly protein TadB